ncbi:hypothetical protein PoB_004804100 [Plakobranchus ocellatus]|uniref:Uncharacterized protein n=1 Tax=Plakobranchus ocellatus TaxID=259542 RepID=A0AAV4BDU9_9GAST|nr:hypothetical protein PoB_004804100 [Plakobranchus ocellatus]
MANYLIMPYAKNNQNPTPGSPMLGLNVGPTLLFIPSLRGDACNLQRAVCSRFESAISTWVKELEITYSWTGYIKTQLAEKN